MVSVSIYAQYIHLLLIGGYFEDLIPPSLPSFNGNTSSVVTNYTCSALANCNNAVSMGSCPNGFAILSCPSSGRYKYVIYCETCL